MTSDGKYRKSHSYSQRFSFLFFFVIEGTTPFRTFGCLRDRPLRAENFEAKLDELERNAPFADRKTPPKNGSLIEIAEAVAE